MREKMNACHAFLSASLHQKLRARARERERERERERARERARESERERERSSESERERVHASEGGCPTCDPFVSASVHQKSCALFRLPHL